MQGLQKKAKGNQTFLNISMDHLSPSEHQQISPEHFQAPLIITKTLQNIDKGDETNHKIHYFSVSKNRSEGISTSYVGPAFNCP